MTLRTLILDAHIAAGTLGLLAGPVAMVAAKGGQVHRGAGKIFFWSMAAVTGSAAALVLFFGATQFLLFVAVLSFYLAFGGVRALRRKRPDVDRATALDWGAAALAVAASAGLALVATDPARYRLPQGFSTVAAAFGVVLFLTAARQVASFVRPPKARNAWRLAHLTGMLAAYIAFVTAFSAVNFRFLPIPVRWLWPLVVGTIGITLWVRHERSKIAPAESERREDSRRQADASRENA